MCLNHTLPSLFLTCRPPSDLGLKGCQVDQQGNKRPLARGERGREKRKRKSRKGHSTVKMGTMEKRPGEWTWVDGLGSSLTSHGPHVARTMGDGAVDQGVLSLACPFFPFLLSLLSPNVKPCWIGKERDTTLMFYQCFGVLRLGGASTAFGRGQSRNASLCLSRAGS